MRRRLSVFKFRSALRGLSGLPARPKLWFREPFSAATLRALAETISWCSRQSLATNSNDPEFLRNRQLLRERKFTEIDLSLLTPLSQQLRSAVLQPSIEIGEAIDEIELERTIASVIERRSRLLVSQEPFDQELILSSRDGRILLYEPAENVADGASQVSSLGFFDTNDAPPWDAWFHYEDRRLGCWVPEHLITLVQNGLDANMVQCIYWADQ